MTNDLVKVNVDTGRESVFGGVVPGVDRSHAPVHETPGDPKPNLGIRRQVLVPRMR